RKRYQKSKHEKKKSNPTFPPVSPYPTLGNILVAEKRPRPKCEDTPNNSQRPDLNAQPQSNTPTQTCHNHTQGSNGTRELSRMRHADGGWRPSAKSGTVSRGRILAGSMPPTYSEAL
ncbi:hypothetical protein V5O48_013902, partial [Marasmius crinis-equi]